MTDAVTFRTATRADLDVALSWASDEGWNPGLDDAEVFWATDPDGFFVAEVAGTVVAAISVVNHGPGFAFLGLYLCQPEYRGQGIGYGLWQHALAHAGDRVVGLDGVPDQQDNYRKSGFALVGQTYRFLGCLDEQSHPALRAVTPEDVPALVAMDGAANGYSKPAFLSAWLEDTDTRQSLVLGDTPRGFATIRACQTRHKIGPVVAETPDDAICLMRGLIDLAGAEEVMIDVPDACAPLMAFCRDAGLEVSFNTARMYRGAAPTSGAGLRTVATMELG